MLKHNNQYMGGSENIENLKQKKYNFNYRRCMPCLNIK